ncbi:hypothetical protein E4H04_04180 [Candidatus Bathyarchaeota archaeon]|nr:MAG: hypothetical protein E4H04_04180 [Candidatus Bathyarchaeota archaeon]
MFTDQRVALYKRSLEDALRRNENVVIFDEPAIGKFVQFAVQSGDGEIVVDIPVEELNDISFNWLKPHMEVTRDQKGEVVSLQKIIKAEFTQYAAEYTDWVFTKIFQLPDTHEVTVNIFS